MDFELKDLEIVENHSIDTSRLTPTRNQVESQAHSENVRNQSLILAELTKEVEELQDKLKLNYRRLLLFEAENAKLAEEKNRYFYEAQTHIEKYKIADENLQNFEEQNDELRSSLQLAKEKIVNLEVINQSQLSEIKRFSKFHLKVQNVVKPYIEQLKLQILTAKKEITSYKSEIHLFKKLNEDFEKQISDLETQLQNEKAAAQIDKNELIRSYEEQIHFLSKEIIAEQNHNNQLDKEIARLKKAVEFKNYFENELIKFKRIHEEDQNKISDLLEKKNFFETQFLNKESEKNDLMTEIKRVESRFEDQEHQLEVTRKQLSIQIEENRLLNERLLRLEKLNSHLSKEISN